MGRYLRRNEKGFTLIELLIVVAIIGVLAAIAIVNLLTAQRASLANSSPLCYTRPQRSVSCKGFYGTSQIFRWRSRWLF